jgi:hypothetical protein
MPSQDSRTRQDHRAANAILTLVTRGQHDIYWQYLQMQSVNELLERDEDGFWPCLLFTPIICGLYRIYHEYRMSEDIARSTGRDVKNDGSIASSCPSSPVHCHGRISAVAR